MELLINLFSNLVSTFLTVVVTITGTFFSYYQDGVSFLSSTYEKMNSIFNPITLVIDNILTLL
ncbi:MAG: hypothetical protein WCT51_04110 [Candidatus Shapirobacteria bacterium]|jgi:phage-related protein